MPVTEDTISLAYCCRSLRRLELMLGVIKSPSLITHEQFFFRIFLKETGSDQLAANRLHFSCLQSSGVSWC